jgi:hypothetical protein
MTNESGKQKRRRTKSKLNRADGISDVEGKAAMGGGE